MKRILLDGGDEGFLFSAYSCIILQLTKRARSDEIQEGDTQFVRSAKGGAKEIYRIGSEIFKQKMEIQSL
jgi:hypothetical protein